MPKRPTAPAAANTAVESDIVFEMAAEVFRVMSAPMRLKIISSLCNGEKNVSRSEERRVGKGCRSRWSADP